MYVCIYIYILYIYIYAYVGMYMYIYIFYSNYFCISKTCQLMIIKTIFSLFLWYLWYWMLSVCMCIYVDFYVCMFLYMYVYIWVCNYDILAFLFSFLLINYGLINFESYFFYYNFSFFEGSPVSIRLLSSTGVPIKSCMDFLFYFFIIYTF